MAVEKQRALLDQADREHWTVVRLSKEAGKQKPRAAKAASSTMSAEKALTRLHKAADRIAPLVEPATSVDSFLVPAGIDAREAAKCTAKARECLDLLEGFEKQLEQMKKRSAADLESVAGKLAGPG